MGYTIKDFVESNHFKGLKLINQTGLDREIRGARIIAVTYMENYIATGALLLTSLCVYDNLDEQTVLYHLEELSKKRISGFVVKRRNGKEQEKLFELFMHFCDEHNITVLELPQNISYWDVVKYVLYQSCDMIIAKYIYSKMVHDEIDNFLSDHQHDKETKERFFKSLETMLGNPISLYDENFRCIYPFTGQKEFTIMDDTEMYVPHIITKHEYIRQKREYVEYIQKINILNYCDYYLVITEKNEPLNELDFITLDNIITALFYLLTQDVTKREMEIKYYRDLRYRMLNGSMSDAEEDDVANLFDLNTTDEYKVVTFYLNPENRRENFSMDQKNETKNIAEALYRYFPKDNVYINANCTLYLYNEKDWKEKKNFRKTLKEIQKDIQDSLNTRDKKYELLIGIGKSVKGYHGLKDSFKDSKAALEYIGLIREVTADKNKTIVDCAKLGFFQIFINIKDKEELRQYIPDSVINLDEQDKKKNSELISTLECYLNHKQSIRKTSELMNAHPRTISYRLSKIVDLTDIDFDNIAEILAVRNGIVILKILEQF